MLNTCKACKQCKEFQEGQWCEKHDCACQYAPCQLAQKELGNKCKIIRKYDAIKGCYGERYEVNSKDTELYNLFKLICIWTTNSTMCDDGSFDTTFELLIGECLEDNPIIMRKIKSLGGIII